MVYVIAVAGMILGYCFGTNQLVQWEMTEKKSRIALVIGMGLIFVPGAFLMQQYGYHLLKIIRYMILLYALLLLSFVDYKNRIIPNRVLLVMMGVRTVLLAAECISFPQVWTEILISSFCGLFGGGFLFLIAGFIARKGLGMGDVKMIAVTGFYLGFQVLMSDLILSLLFTVLGGLFNLVIRKKSMKSELPFAPFLALGTWVAILLGC